MHSRSVDMFKRSEIINDPHGSIYRSIGRGICAPCISDIDRKGGAELLVFN